MNTATLQSLAEGVFRASWQASVLAVVILAIHLLLGRRIPARVRYGLWSLVVLRLALPVVIPSPVSVHNFYVPPKPIQRVALMPPAPIPTELRRTIAAPRMELAPVVSTANGLSWPMRLSITWAFGAGVTLALVLLASLRLSLHVRRQRPVTDERPLRILKSAAADLRLRRLPALLTGPEAGGPALVGFIRPRLLLPEPVLRFEDDALRLILLHELAHQQRRDVPANWVLALLQAVHWFNPIVHLVFARVRADRELACDERVLSLSKSADRPAYGRTIVRLVESLSNAPRIPAPAVGILEGRHQLRRRIAMIAEHRPVRRAWSLVALVAASLIAAVACTDAVRGDDSPKANVPVQPAKVPGQDAEPTQAALATQPDFGTLELNLESRDKRLSKRLPQLKMEGIPLSDMLDFMRDAAGVNLFVDHKGLEAAGVDMSAPVTLNLKDVTVEQAFRLIGRSVASPGVELGATADGDVIVFGVMKQRAQPSGPADPGGFSGMEMGMEGMPGGAGGGYAPFGRRGPAAEKAITRVYNVDALCGSDQAKLQTLVQVMMGSLNVGTSALVNVQPFNGKLVVTATPDLQEQVMDLLAMLEDVAPGSAATRPAPQTQGF